MCAIVSGLVLNFFFTHPRYSVTIAEPANIVSILVMIAVAIAVSLLVDTSARRHRQATQSGRDADLLTLFARAALRAPNLEALLERVRTVYTQDGVSFLGGDRTILGSVGEQPPRSEDGATTAIEAEPGDHLLLTGPRLTGHDRKILAVVADHASALVRNQELAQAAANSQAVTETDRLRRSLLSAVGHDLRTPLAAAKLSISSLRAADVDFDPEDTAELLATVEESIDHLTALVDNLLDSSRLAAGVVQPTPQHVDVEETAMTALVAATVGRKSDRQRVTVDTDGVTAWADPGLLERVLGNLLDNALRHAPGSAVRLTARTLWDTGHARTLIAVADDGAGIAAESRQTVLRSFHRQGDTNRSSGIGLGLSVVRGFVEAMGGTVSIDETPGGGTTVEVDLPACRETGDQVDGLTDMIDSTAGGASG